MLHQILRSSKLFIFLTLLHAGLCEIDLYEYYKMPLMHRQDDFERCLWSRKELSVYCTFHTLIKPDPTSELWKQVEDFSNDTKKHFAHDLIFAGLCLHECEAKLSKLTDAEKAALYVEEFPWRFHRKWSYESWIHKNASEYRKKYDKTFNQCENLWLRENYNLSGYSKVQWCTTNQEFDHNPYDFLDHLFIILSVIIAIIVVSAIVLDMILNETGNLSHYKTEVKKKLSRGKTCLLCFSIVRNWYRLTAPPKTEIARDLRFLGPIRYMTMIVIILGHIVAGYFMTPGINTQFLEKSNYGFGWSITNWLHLVVQTFFVASGALLYISFYGILKDNQFNIKYILAAVVYRYVRLTPVFAYVLLFHATFLYRWGYGAYWKFFAEKEMSYCRNNGWTNLLYVNNYVHSDQQCMLHTWYLAADTQMFLVALVLFMIMFKYPKYKRITISIAFLISCIIQFTVTYTNGYLGIYLMTPEAKRFFLDNVQKEFVTDYMTAHTNFGNYIIGIILAMIYFRIKKTKFDISQYKIFVVVWHLIPIIAFLVLSYITYIFVNYKIETPSIWVSLVAVFTRNFWGIVAISFVLGFLSSLRSPIKNLFHWPVLNTLSRLTFCIYLSHSGVARLMICQANYLIDMSVPLVFVQLFAVFVGSNVAALILCLCLEFPLTALSKEIFRTRVKQRIENHAEECKDSNNCIPLRMNELQHNSPQPVFV